MTLMYMILGWLMEGPLHGYLLKKGPLKAIFSEFGINDNQLYPALRKLESRSLIKKTIEQGQGSPNRNVFSITDAGRREFLEWLRSGDGEERPFRYDFFRKDEFFIRCNFIGHLSKQESLEKIDGQVRIVGETIRDLTAARDDMLLRGVDPLHVKILEYGIMSQETRLRWLEDFRKAANSRKEKMGKRKGIPDGR